MANHKRDLKAALESGVRALELDVHYTEDYSSTLCHTFMCRDNIRNIPLRPKLQEIKDFLDEKPRNVVVLFIEQYISTTDLIADFQSVEGLTEKTYHHPATTSLAEKVTGAGRSTAWLPALNASCPQRSDGSAACPCYSNEFPNEGDWNSENCLSEGWPTLEDLIDNGTNLIVFTDKPQRFCGIHRLTRDVPIDRTLKLRGDESYSCDSGQAYWLHYMPDFVADTDDFGEFWNMKTPDELVGDCSFKRGAVSTPVSPFKLTSMNHFLNSNVATGKIEKAWQVNFNDNCTEGKEEDGECANALRRARKCSIQWEHRLNFLKFDFWGVGNLTDIVYELNEEE